MTIVILLIAAVVVLAIGLVALFVAVGQSKDR